MFELVRTVSIYAPAVGRLLGTGSAGAFPPFSWDDFIPRMRVSNGCVMGWRDRLTHAQGFMRAVLVVIDQPLIVKGPHLFEGCKQICIQHLGSVGTIEAFDEGSRIGLPDWMYWPEIPWRHPCLKMMALSASITQESRSDACVGPLVVHHS